MRLITLSDKFKDVADQLENNESEWRSWFDLEQPEQAPLPNGYSDTMDIFEQMLLIRLCVWAWPLSELNKTTVPSPPSLPF